MRREHTIDVRDGIVVFGGLVSIGGGGEVHFDEFYGRPIHGVT